MKLIFIYQTEEAIQTVYKLSLPYSKTRNILELKMRVTPEIQFYCEQQIKLINEYAKKDINGNVIKNGKITFETIEDMDSYCKRKKELDDTEIEWDFPIIQITEKEMGDQCISGKDIENLKGFIEFGGE